MLEGVISRNTFYRKSKLLVASCACSLKVYISCRIHYIASNSNVIFSPPGPGNASVDITSRHRRYFQENNIYKQNLDRTIKHFYEQMSENINRIQRIQRDNYLRLDSQVSDKSSALILHAPKTSHSAGHFPSKCTPEWKPNKKFAGSPKKYELELNVSKHLHHSETYLCGAQQCSTGRNSRRSKICINPVTGTSKKPTTSSSNEVCSGKTTDKVSSDKSAASLNVKIENTLTCFPLSSSRRQVSADRWKRQKERHLAIYGISGCFTNPTRQYLSRDVFERLSEPINRTRQGHLTSENGSCNKYKSTAKLHNFQELSDGSCNKYKSMAKLHNFQELSECRYLRS